MVELLPMLADEELEMVFPEATVYGYAGFEGCIKWHSSTARHCQGIIGYLCLHKSHQTQGAGRYYFIIIICQPGTLSDVRKWLVEEGFKVRKFSRLGLLRVTDNKPAGLCIATHQLIKEQ